MPMETGERLHRFEANPNPNPLPETRVTVSFGRLAIPKLVEQLDVNQPIEIIRGALDIISQKLFKNLGNVVQAVDSQVMVPLDKLMVAPEADVRVHALNAVKCMAAHPVGRAAIVAEGLIANLHKGLQDKEVGVKVAAYDALLRLSAATESCPALIEAENLIEFLIQQTKVEKTWELRVKALDAVANVLVVPSLGVKVVMDNGGVEASVLCLANKFRDVRRAAANLLSRICLVDEGRRSAVAIDDTVPSLAAILPDPVATVRLAVSSALMCATIEEKAKHEFVDTGLKHVMKLLPRPGTVAVQYNLVKIVSHMSCLPKARRMMQDGTVVEDLQKLSLATEDNLLKEVIDTAIRNVLWEP